MDVCREHLLPSNLTFPHTTDHGRSDPQVPCLFRCGCGPYTFRRGAKPPTSDVVIMYQNEPPL